MRRSLPLRRLAISAVALAVAIGMTGCGESDQRVEVRGTDALAAAAEATGSATFTAEGRTEVEGPGGATLVTRTTFEFDGEQSRMTMTMPDEAGGIEMEQVVSQDRAFLRYTGLPEMAPLPDGWIELTAVQSSAAITSSASADSFLDAFRAKDAEIVDDGTVDRDGQLFRRFTTTVDLSSQFRLDTSNRVLSRMMDSMASAMRAVTTTIDVDDDGRIVRMAYDIDTAGGVAHSVITFGAFGEAVTIDVPADATPMTMDEFAELAYPTLDEDPTEVDESELIDRDEFIDGMADAGALDDDLAGCIYDELRATSPSALRAEAFEQEDLPMEAAQAMTSAAMICGVG